MPKTTKGHVGRTGIAGEIRDVIASFEGREFRSTELPRYKSLHSLLAKLVTSGEIRRWYTKDFLPNNKLKCVYQEIKLKVTRINAAKPEPQPMAEAWRDVWPEFFNLPAIQGKSYKHVMWAKD